MRTLNSMTPYLTLLPASSRYNLVSLMLCIYNMPDTFYSVRASLTDMGYVLISFIFGVHLLYPVFLKDRIKADIE